MSFPESAVRCCGDCHLIGVHGLDSDPWLTQEIQCGLYWRFAPACHCGEFDSIARGYQRQTAFFDHVRKLPGLLLVEQDCLYRGRVYDDNLGTPRSQ